MFSFLKKHLVIELIGVAFVYYSLLSSHQFSWVFVGADSGDWLAASQMWFVPQPLGSPLFIILGHFLNLFPGDLVIKMTILLSCLPAAITVGLVYLITRHLTHRTGIGITCALVTLGATILLTQATILEEYAIAGMFVALAYWFYLKDKRGLVAVSLALGTAIHAVVLPIAIIWLIVERKRWREFVKPGVAYLFIVAAFYSVILIIMASGAPPFMAGGLNWHSLWIYVTTTAGAVVGNGSIFDFPATLLRAIGMLVVSIGLGVVPLAYAFKRPLGRPIWIMLATILFFLWYHITNLDPTTWTFMTFATPFLAVLIGLGLARLGMRHLKAVVAGACCLILVNGFFMNANVVAGENPEATRTLTAYMEMPEDTALVTLHGHYSLALFYAISEGRDDLIPVLYDAPAVGVWPDYEDWLEDEYGIKGDTIIEWTERLLELGRPVYVVGEDWRYENIDEERWERYCEAFPMVEVEGNWLREITGG